MSDAGLWVTRECEFFHGERRIVIPEGAAVEIWNRVLDRLPIVEEEQTLQQLAQGRNTGRPLVALWVCGAVCIVPRAWLTTEQPEHVTAPYSRPRSKAELKELEEAAAEAARPKQKSLF